MSRRSSLPGAAELFRPTSNATGEPATDAHLTAVPPTRELRLAPPTEDALAGPTAVQPALVRQTAARRGPRTAGERQPSGRERHDEKITVYVSQGELVDLEQARLTLRAVHGLAVDRGRIVREALAVVLADLDAHGASSTLVRRLIGS